MLSGHVLDKQVAIHSFERTFVALTELVGVHSPHMLTHFNYHVAAETAVVVTVEHFLALMPAFDVDAQIILVVSNVFAMLAREFSRRLIVDSLFVSLQDGRVDGRVVAVVDQAPVRAVAVVLHSHVTLVVGTPAAGVGTAVAPEGGGDMLAMKVRVHGSLARSSKVAPIARDDDGKFGLGHVAARTYRRQLNHCSD